LILLQTKAQASVKTSGSSGPVVSNGVQHSGTAMPVKVCFCRLHHIIYHCHYCCISWLRLWV